jgi:hypothetical protein
VNPKEPPFTGVPLMVPEELGVSPPGRLPEVTDHVYGGVPPEAARACEYGVPTVPAGSDDVVIPKAGAVMASESAAVVDTWALSVTRTVKLLVPAAPGVPDIVPLADRVNPDGGVPLATVHEYGGVPPEAASAWE